MRYQIYNAPGHLRDYVRYFWSIDHDNDGDKDKTIKIFADRFPRLIFQNLDGHVATKTETGLILPTTFLSGIITKQTQYYVKGSYSHLGVSFYPHAIKAIFGVDACELTNSLPDLINFCSTELIEKLYEVNTHYQRVGIISEYLLAKLIKEPGTRSGINPIIHAHLNYQTSLKDILTYNRVSERHLERLFNNHIGISPKKYLRILRFEKTIEALNSGQYIPLSKLAYQIGYADQAHFNKEFKSFSGFTPKSFQNQRKFGQEASSFLIK